jgi:hypothetical protein
MKHDRQIGIRVGLPAFFALEVEDVYRHTSGAHRALAFPDFLGLLIGMGLEEYRRAHNVQPEAPDIGDTPEKLPEGESVNLFDIPRTGLHDLFREFDEAMELPEAPEGLRLARAGKDSE